MVAIARIVSNCFIHLTLSPLTCHSKAGEDLLFVPSLCLPHIVLFTLSSLVIGIRQSAEDNVRKRGIPTGFCNKAQGCEERATLGSRARSMTTLKGLRPAATESETRPLGL